MSTLLDVMSIGAMLVLNAATLMLMWAAGGVQGKTIRPSSRDDVHYLKAGDQLRLVCEQPVSSANASANVVWSKASSLTVGGQSPEVRDLHRKYTMPADHDLNYQTIDTTQINRPNGRPAPYTITESRSTGGVREGYGVAPTGKFQLQLISELIKEDVTSADSGFYRCRLGLGGVSSRILVTVIDITTKNAQLERVHNDTQLECLVADFNGSTDYAVTWYKHGGDSGDILIEPTVKNPLTGRFKYEVTKRDDGTNVLTVKRAGDGDIGLYRCATILGNGTSQTALKQDAHLYAYPHVRNFQASRNVVNGHSLELICQAWGWPTPHVTWYRGHTELNSTVDIRVTLSDWSGIVNAKLTIDDIGSSPDDRGYYTCVAAPPSGEKYSYDGRNATIFVRVKDRLAALWPLLGIAAEAIILLVIITAYEMKRNTAMTSAADEVVPADNKANAAGGQSLKPTNSTAGNSHHTTSNDDHNFSRKNI